MGIRFACHACGKQLNIKQDLAGRRGVCPDCATQFRIPAGDAEKSIPLTSQSPSAVDGVSAPAASKRVAKVADKRVAGPIVAGKSVDLIANDPDATWYVRPPSGGQYGPADGTLLQQWIGEGRVAATALIWRDGWPQWRSADEALPEIAAELPGASGRINGNGGNAFVASSDKSPSAMPSVAGAPVVPAETPQFSGESGIGATRRNRSFKRVLWIAILSMIAIALAVLLFFLVNRPVE